MFLRVSQRDESILMDKKISTFAERQAENKRKLDNNHQAQQQLPKRQNVVQAYAAVTGERKDYRISSFHRVMLKDHLERRSTLWQMGEAKPGMLDPSQCDGKCYANEPLAIPLDRLHFDDKLHFVEEPIEIIDREVKRLKRSQILLVKVDELLERS
ncbi:hypothetical protein Tco_0086351 [Tanacetum coccineum]